MPLAALFQLESLILLLKIRLGRPFRCLGDTMKRSVVIFEAEGGIDKGTDGHRADSIPILNALLDRGFEGELCFYNPARPADLLDRYAGRATVALSRVNPGNLPDTDAYWQFLRALADQGTVVQTHPDVMSALCFKDLFYKLRDTPYAPESTDFYYSVDDLHRRLPLSLASGPRVLKKNFTATGVGVWKVEREEDGTLVCTEAVDNAVTRFGGYRELFRFLEPVYHEQVSSHPRYFKHRQGLLDVPFLPGIHEGEVRVFFTHDQPFHILHKQPQEGSFSATLFSGARYTSDARLTRWQPVVEYALWGLEAIRPHLEGLSFPVIWSIDVIPYGAGKHVFSDINAASVGFSSPELVDRLSELVAQEICRELDGVSRPPPSIRMSV
jgi:hypothetical protein